MATLPLQQTKILSTTINLVAAAGGGDKVKPNDRVALLVKNGSGSAITVTVVVPGNTKQGQAEPDVPVSVAAGAMVAIGPLTQDLADPTDGLVHVTYSSVTTVTVGTIAI